MQSYFQVLGEGLRGCKASAGRGPGCKASAGGGPVWMQS